MTNAFMPLIGDGRIQTLDELKAAYHKAIMRTHPDAVGSNMYLESYLELRGKYEEAKAYLAKRCDAQNNRGKVAKKNHRLAFFEQLSRIESLEMPYAFHPVENMDQLLAAKSAAMDELSNWKNELAALYRSADLEYTRIKSEKPRGPYLKHALALNIRPLVHNLIGYHLTGRDLYAKQAKQNLTGIMHRLSENGRDALRAFLAFLLDDMKNGPAVLE